MYPTPVQKFLRRFLVGWIVIVIVLLVLYVIFLSPLSPFHMCTLMGCRDTLDLMLTHEPTSPYTIQLTSSTGETRQITCTPGKISMESDNSVICRTGIVTIYGFTPAKVAVEITWQDGSFKIDGTPTYKNFRPNGPFCAPTCRLGKLAVNLP